MSIPEDGREPMGKRRALPSVDMALLPHEVRAARARTTALAIGAGLAGVAALGLWLGPHVVTWIEAAAQTPAASSDPWPSERAGDLALPIAEKPPEPALAAVAIADGAEPGPEIDTEAPAIAELAAAAPALAEAATEQAFAEPLAAPGATVERVVRAFGRARGFRDALVKGGATEGDADSLTKALEKLVNFRRCKPEDELSFERDASGMLTAFEYKASTIERYRAERAADGSFKGHRIEVTVEHKRIARGGYISDSLGRALEALGMSSNLAGVFVEAFEGTIDFKKDTRQGDSFRLLLDEQIVDGKSLGYGPVLAAEYHGEKRGKHLAFWYEAEGLSGDFYDESGRALHGGWLRTPLRYDHISSGYNPRRRHPILRRIMPHHGIDYAAAPGTPVWAAADGVVTFAGARGANGNLVSIKHEGGYETHYAHLLRITRGIKSGTVVKQRQSIGAVGSTGRSTGPHLHFALKRHGTFMDPAKQLNGPGKQLSASRMPEFKRQVAQLKRELTAIPLAAAPAPVGEQAGDAETFHEENDL